MLTQELSVEIRVLARQGMSIRAIAQQLRVSRNTVRKYLRNPGLPIYPNRAARPTKLDPFKPYLQARIQAAKPHWIPATVLLRELREHGYTGGLSQLKAWLSPLRHDASGTVVRFETAPGKQMQVDFTIIRRGNRPLKAFVATLGFSRASYVRFFDHERNDAWLTGLREACHFFGGVPQEVLFDNASTIIRERDAYGEGDHRWHPALLALAEEFGFLPRVCRPYRAQTKGKVERFNGYLKRSFVTPLAATLKQAGLALDVSTANAHIGPWLQDIANQRSHGTTGEVPAIRLQQELPHFLPLPQALPVSPGTTATARPMPLESLQHPLSVYQDLLEVNV